MCPQLQAHFRLHAMFRPIIRAETVSDDANASHAHVWIGVPAGMTGMKLNNVTISASFEQHLFTDQMEQTLNITNPSDCYGTLSCATAPTRRRAMQLAYDREKRANATTGPRAPSTEKQNMHTSSATNVRAQRVPRIKQRNSLRQAYLFRANSCSPRVTHELNFLRRAAFIKLTPATAWVALSFAETMSFIICSLLSAST